MWNENLVIIVKGWDPRGGEGKFARHPHTKRAAPGRVHQARASRGVRPPRTRGERRPRQLTRSSPPGALRGWGRRPGTRRLGLGYGKWAGAPRPARPGEARARPSADAFGASGPRCAGRAPGLPIPQGLQRSVPAASRPGPSSASNPDTPARPAPVPPGRPLPPPGRPPLPLPSRHPALLTGLSPPHSGRSPSSHSATLPSFHSAARGHDVHLYGRFGGVKHQGLPITRRGASRPDCKACREARSCPRPSPHLALQKSPNCLGAKLCSRSMRRACEAGAAISE